MKLGVVLRADRLIAGQGFQRQRVVTEYGVTDRLFSGSLHGVESHFLYGRFPGRRTPSWDIPYQANQAAFDALGVDHIVGTFVVGGIAPDIAVGDIVIPQDLVSFTGPFLSMDRPGARRYSNAHVIPAMCPALRELLLRGAARAGVPVRADAIYLCYYGFSRIETRAELDLFERLGLHIVGQTLDPELTLARRRNRHYAAMAVVIDSHHHEQERDQDQLRLRSRELIRDGRARFEAIIEAALADRPPHGPVAGCTCALPASEPDDDPFASFPEGDW